MVMPECQKFTGTEVNQHSGETLALNVPAETYLGNKLHAEIQNFQYIWAISQLISQHMHSTNYLELLQE
jgi:hypothetical protein